MTSSSTSFKDLVWQSLKGWFEDIERAGTWHDDTAAAEASGYLTGKLSEPVTEP